nr:MAG: nonstructural protein [Eriocheir sinensis marnavirus 2]
MIFASNANNDPHYLWVGNSTYQRLCRDAEARNIARLTFPSVRPLQVYTIVSDVERELDGCTQMHTLQSDERSFYEETPEDRSNRSWNTLNLIAGKYLRAKFTEAEIADMNDSIWFHIESLQALWYQCSRAQMVPDYWYCISSYIRCVTGKPVFVGATQLFERLANWLNEAIAMVAEELQSSDEQVGGENPFTRFRNWLQRYQSLVDHPIVQRVKKIFRYVMSFSLLERFGITFSSFWYDKAEEEYVRSTHSSTSDFVISVVEGVSFILERLYDCYQTGTWSPIIHSGRNYAAWVDAIYKIKEDATKLHNPEAHGLSYHEFVARVKNAIEKGESICKYSVDVPASDKNLLKRLLSEVRLIEADLLTKAAARQARDAPFTVLYYGGSGIGKSTLQKLTFSHFGKLFKLPTEDEYHYPRSPDNEYWSGFQTSVWSLVLDDIAAQNPNMGPDKSMSEILQIVNNIPYTPPQADLADKGRTPLRVELVQATTNTKSLNAASYYCNQLAILRRFPNVVTATVKSEYASNPEAPAEERMLDSAKCPPLASGIYPDYWRFEVEKVRPYMGTDGKQYARYELVHIFDDIYNYMAWLSSEAMAHKRNQQVMKNAQKSYMDTDVCDSCYRPMVACACSQVQSQEMVVATCLVTCGIVTVVIAAWVYAVRQCRLWLAWFQREIETQKERAIEYATRVAEQKATQIVETCIQRVAADADIQAKGAHALEQVASRVSVARVVKERITRTKDESAAAVEDIFASVKTRVRAAALSAKDKLEMERRLLRDQVKRIGDAVRSNRMTQSALLALVVGLPLAAMAYKTYKQLQTFDLQSSWTEGERIHATDEKPNPWYRDDYRTSEFDVGMLTSSWKALNQEQITAKVQRNCAYAEAKYQRDGVTKLRPMRLLALGGQLYVTNNHNIADVPEMMLSIHLNSREIGVGSSFEFRLVTSTVFRMPDKDLAFFLIGSVPPKTNLLDLLPGEGYNTVCNGLLLGRSPEGVSEQMLLRAISKGIKTTELGGIPSWLYQTRQDTVMGQCGSAVLGMTPVGPMIMGLHQTGGANFRGSAVCLTRQDAQRALEHFDRPLVQAGEPDLRDAQGRVIELQPLHPKSTFRYLETGVADVYGTLPGFRGGGKSKVAKTFIHDACVKRGYPVTTAAPVMRGYVPWRHAVRDVVEQQFTVDQSLLDECIEAFAHDIMSGLKESDKKELVTLDNDATLNGLPGVKFIDKMKRSTSMGFPWRKRKSHYLVNMGEYDVWQDYVKFDDAFYERVDGIIAKYEQGVRHCPIFINHLKDEPQKKSKVEEGKTRVFSGGPADWSFVVRKYLLSFVRVVQNNKLLFESCPGTNAASAEWDVLYHHLTQFGTERIVAGDYSKFDKKMNAQMILAAFSVIDKVMRDAGRSERDRRIIACIAYDIAFPMSDVNGDLVQFWGSNPSGHPLTVIVNGLVNALYVRYCWRRVGNDLSRFKQQVALLTYGDDNIMGISPQVQNFDHTVLVKYLAEIGVTYTMADKEAESVPFVSIRDVTFLKRGWRYDPEVGSHVAQLEHDSIAKALTMHLPSTEVCDEAKAVQALEGALYEYFYYGREEFNKRRQMFLEIIEECELEPYVTRELPFFDQLLNNYLEESKEFYPTGMCPRCVGEH